MGERVQTALVDQAEIFPCVIQGKRLRICIVSKVGPSIRVAYWIPLLWPKQKEESSSSGRMASLRLKLAET
jgi:hypothetical protein